MDKRSLKLRSGHSIPVLGLGTWRLTGALCEKIVRQAIELGYRHIDTAELYGNEHEIGRAIKGFDRSDLFLVSKVWASNLCRGDLLKACENSLKLLGTSYLDLYLIHWPSGSVPIGETMGAMAELVDNGMVRSTGVSNFDMEWCKKALDASRIPVSVNQVEFHPHLYQGDLLDFCKGSGIVLTAYSPLARTELLDDGVLKRIAEGHGKTPAQVSLRWLVQHGMAVIPKSSSVEHLKENIDIFGWKLKKKEMDDIDAIRVFKRQVNPVLHKIPFFDTVAERYVKWNHGRRKG
ncbi:MAG: aldo/keto reductase [Candidatus Aenigmarchaeota archaeon]|nr:aldo/keto reductase [Candidatus Aenigmarchaeota archaeon]